MLAALSCDPSRAPGRSHVLFASDEIVAPGFDFVTAPNQATGNQTPTHILGLITLNNKLGLYANWLPQTLNISPLDQQGEFYDYQTANGAAEIDNTFANNLHAAEMRRQLLNIYLPAELRAPMPLSLQPAQQASEQLMVAFLENLESSGE